VVKNGKETDVDCGGGACTKCAPGKTCSLASDCTSSVCKAGLCQAATCNDGAKNGAESDVDCGAACAPTGLCSLGKTCGTAGDCQSGLCSGGLCAACSTMDDCASGNNCVAGACTPATTSCTQEKALHGSPDGEYWINPSGTPQRVYCDMQLGVVLCSETATLNSGQTRDGSHLPIQMMSVLNHAQGTCDLWALRATDKFPIDFYSDNFGTGLNTCSAIGFKSVAKATGCLFGSSNGYGNCGYDIGTNYYRYGTNCSGCSQYNGLYPSYQLQGYMFTATVATDFAGNQRLSCKMK
jgi:hypothetical protein